MTSTAFISAHAATFVAYASFAVLLAFRGARTWLLGLLIIAVAATAAWALAGLGADLFYVPLWSELLASAVRDAAWLGLSFGLMFPRVGQTLLWRGLVALALLIIALQLSLDFGLFSVGSLAGVSIDAALIHVATTFLSLVLL